MTTYHHRLALQRNGPHSFYYALMRGETLVAAYDDITEAGQGLLDAEAGLIGAAAVNRVLGEALNSGDGVYRP